MKNILIVIAVIFSFLIVSCSSNGTSKRAIEEGKVAIVSKEYEKARDLFQLALNEDNKSKIAKDLLELCNNYISLLDIYNSGKYDTVDELISDIENNNELEIIKVNFEETKKKVLENKEAALKYGEEINEIEKLLTDGNIDQAKSKATAKLVEVEGFKVLEDRLNGIINNVNEIIVNAKNEIIKHDKGREIEYRGLKDSSYNGYDLIPELQGKTLMYFNETGTEFSPKEYMYDRDSSNIYNLDQGSIFWVNNNNKIIYPLEEPKTNISKPTPEIKISSEESRKIALDYYISKRPGIAADEVLVAMGDDINDKNEYYRGICGYIDDAKTIPGKVIAEYYVNATTGKIRVLWEW